MHNKDRCFKNTESETLKTTNPVFSFSRTEICLRGSVSGHHPAPSAKLGQRCHFEFLPVNGAHAPSCETEKYLFLDEKQHGGAPRAPFCKRCVHVGVTGAPSRCDLLSCASKGVCRWVCFVVSSSGAEVQGKGCGHAADRAHGWVCGPVPTHAGYQGEEPAASST